MAEFILEDEKLVTEGIPSDRIPSNINLRTGNRLKVATNVFPPYFPVGLDGKID